MRRWWNLIIDTWGAPACKPAFQQAVEGRLTRIANARPRSRCRPRTTRTSRRSAPCPISSVSPRRSLSRPPRTTTRPQSRGRYGGRRPRPSTCGCAYSTPSVTPCSSATSCTCSPGPASCSAPSSRPSSPASNSLCCWTALSRLTTSRTVSIWRGRSRRIRRSAVRARRSGPRTSWAPAATRMAPRRAGTPGRNSHAPLPATSPTPSPV